MVITMNLFRYIHLNEIGSRSENDIYKKETLCNEIPRNN